MYSYCVNSFYFKSRDGFWTSIGLNVSTEMDTILTSLWRSHCDHSHCFIYNWAINHNYNWFLRRLQIMRTLSYSRWILLQWFILGENNAPNYLCVLCRSWRTHSCTSGVTRWCQLFLLYVKPSDRKTDCTHLRRTGLRCWWQGVQINHMTRQGELSLVLDI